MPRHSPLPRPDDSDDSSEEDADPESRMAARLWWQWDRRAHLALQQGAGGGLRHALRHLLWACVQGGLLLLLTEASAWGGTGKRRCSLLLRNAFLLHYVLEFLGCTGMYSGFSPLFPYTRYRFAPGTLKEPLLGCLGDRRTLLDVSVSAANVAVPLWLMTVPQESGVMCAFAGCVFALLITDCSAYIGAMGCFYGPISAILAFRALLGDAGHIAALQVLLFAVYVGCGVAKMGPGFALVTALEWTHPPLFAGRERWQRLFFRDPGSQDWRPSRLAAGVARGAAVAEWAFPLLFFCSPPVLAAAGLGWLGAWPVNAALLAICCMHGYIVLHLGSDVNVMNAVTLLWCVSVFRVSSVGFDYDGLARMPPALQGFLALALLYVAAGHVWPDRICSQASYRFWAGNWPQAFYLFSEAGLAKLGAAPARVQLPSPARAWGACAYLWASQLPVRALPWLLWEVGRTRPQLKALLPAYTVTNYCLGSASNCSLRALALNPRLQRACGFEEGEALCVFCGALRPGGGPMRWEVADLRAGVVAAGSLPREALLALARPSDCQGLSGRFPLAPGKQ